MFATKPSHYIIISPVFIYLINFATSVAWISPKQEHVNYLGTFPVIHTVHNYLFFPNIKTKVLSCPDVFLPMEK